MTSEREALPNYLRKYIVNPETGCWLWNGSVGSNGYGRYGDKPAHRLVYEALKGAIPTGLEADHLCNVTTCVNPDHIEPKSPRDNKMRSNCACAIHARKTHCIHGHPFNHENTYVPPKRPTRRYCKQCMKDRKSALRNAQQDRG